MHRRESIGSLGWPAAEIILFSFLGVHVSSGTGGYRELVHKALLWFSFVRRGDCKFNPCRTRSFFFFFFLIFF
uniref:Putative secreted protein n=1 Tax=Ixodes ricinus TaxID=34613 RepID=A0A6B0U136_IXORI